jgi:hypothetical protein
LFSKLVHRNDTGSAQRRYGGWQVRSAGEGNPAVRIARVAAERSGSLLVVGDLTLDEDSREARRAGQAVNLTAPEFELLRFLMRNTRRVLSKAQVPDRVGNYDFGGQANIVELYVSYLRKKIDGGREPMIHTMRAAGRGNHDDPVAGRAADQVPDRVRAHRPNAPPGGSQKNPAGHSSSAATGSTQHSRRSRTESGLHDRVRP